MKNKILNQKALKDFFYALLVVILFGSCADEKNLTSTEVNNDSPIPMWKEYYYEGGMKFVILRDKYQGNITIINITKDSLACEYFKQY